MSFDIKRMFKIERNLSIKEKEYRLYGGIAMLVVSLFTASIPLLLFGVFCVVEFYLSWCPVCAGMNRNTYEGNSE